ncbi:hypothetical protein [Geminicoccus roseus]|uniref:hypothetical protein n=1 Tax=Geminicoccus roseus TaxID=404900 RepID=UPI00040C8233|nr:hypothetical protein [Geminicoccus roseus]
MVRTVAFLGGLFLAAQAQATTLPYLDLNALVRGADGVVEGTVASVTSGTSGDGGIFTYVTLGDLRVHAGSYGQDRFTLMLMGGSAGGETLKLVGAPSFQPGQRVIAFVAGNGTRIVPLVGWEQGLFQVVPDDGQRVVADSVGNRLLEVEGGRIEKEQRHAFEAEIIDPAAAPAAPGPGTARSAAGSGGSQAGSPALSAPSAAQASTQADEPVSYGEFVQAIRQAARQAALSAPRQAQAALHSVPVGAAMQQPVQRPGLAASTLKEPGRERGGGIKAPLASEEPGNVPAGPGNQPANP